MKTSRIRLEELPEAMRRQAAAQLAAAPRVTSADQGSKMEEVMEPAWHGREKDLQASVERVLGASGWRWFHMPGAAARGNPAGWPDLIAFGPAGRVALIELKTSRGFESDRQKMLFGALRALGHTVYVCRSVAQVARIIKEPV